MATATTTLRVSLPSPRGGLRHHMPSPVSPRLKPHKIKLPDVRHDPFQAVIRAARVSGDPHRTFSTVRDGWLRGVLADAFRRITCAVQVYCSGELLAAVQMSGLFEDCKEFVDMTMRKDPEEIMQVRW